MSCSDVHVMASAGTVTGAGIATTPMHGVTARGTEVHGIAREDLAVAEIATAEAVVLTVMLRGAGA